MFEDAGLWTASSKRGDPVTEDEWLLSVNPQQMIAVLDGKGSDRLWRLFAVACARRIEHLMRDPWSRQALSVAEQFADDAASKGDLAVARARAQESAWQAGCEEYMDEVRANFHWDAEHEAIHEATCAAQAAVQCVADDIGNKPCGQGTVIGEAFQLPDLLREIFGNPFRWTVVDPVWIAWNDGEVVKLATFIYEERAFDRLPILADALEEAGCHDHAILSHCRQPGEHTRGCWALDLLLGKS